MLMTSLTKFTMFSLALFGPSCCKCLQPRTIVRRIGTVGSLAAARRVRELDFLERNLETKEKLDKGLLSRLHLNVSPAFRQALKLPNKKKSSRVFIDASSRLCLNEVRQSIAEKLCIPEEVLALSPMISEAVETENINAANILETNNDLSAAWEACGNNTLRLNVFPSPSADLSRLHRGKQRGTGQAAGPDLSLTVAMQMLSFYSFVPVKDPDELAQRLRSAWAPLGALGRIYVGTEGINAQMSVPDVRNSSFLGSFKQKKKEREKQRGGVVEEEKGGRIQALPSLFGRLPLCRCAFAGIPRVLQRGLRALSRDRRRPP